MGLPRKGVGGEMTIRYYHGGITGLKAGDYLVPPDEQTCSNGKRIVDYAEQGGVDPRFIHRDRVYVTSDLKASRAFAAMLPHGAVYLVEPKGAMEVDPDCTDGTSWMCERAQIIKVSDPCVKFEEKDLFKWLKAMRG
jgi:hypothetical protein